MTAWIKKEAYGTKKLFMMLHCVLFSVVSAGLWNFKIDGQKKTIEFGLKDQHALKQFYSTDIF